MRNRLLHNYPLRRVPTTPAPNVSSLDDVTADSAETDPVDRRCPICFDDIVDDIVFLSCTHKFHNACVSGWVRSKNTCPLCRAVQHQG
jgi:SUMO ligase MMS21 Smc5/6 complex component